MFTEKLFFSLSPSEKLAFWCQKVLPQVYDDSLSYIEVLYKVQAYLNDLENNMDTVNDAVTQTASAFNNLVDYVNNYFDTVNLTDAIRENINQDIASGVFDELINSFLDTIDVTSLNIPTYYNDDMNVSMETTDNLVRFIPNEFRQGNNPMGGSSPNTAVCSVAPIPVYNNVGETLYICADKSFVASNGFGVYNVTAVFYTADNTRIGTEIRCWTGATAINAPIPENAYNMYLVLSTGGTGQLLTPTMLNELYPLIYVGFNAVTTVSGIYHYRIDPTESIADLYKDYVTTDMDIWAYNTDNLYKVIPENWKQGVNPLTPEQQAIGAVYDSIPIEIHEHIGETMYLSAVKTAEFRTLRVEFYDMHFSRKISDISINGNTTFGSGVVPTGAFWAYIVITAGGTGLSIPLDQFLKIHYKVYVGFTNIVNYLNIYPSKYVDNYDTRLKYDAYIHVTNHAIIVNTNHRSSDLIRVHAGDVVNVKAYATDGGASLLTFYSDVRPESGTSLCIGNTRYLPVYKTFVAEEDGYVRWCTRTDMVGRSYFAINEEFEGIPAYWYEYLHKKLDEISVARSGIVDCAEYLYITDVHWLRNAQHSPEIINWLVKRLGTPIVVFGGDIIELHAVSKALALEEMHHWRDRVDTEKMLISLGNHDNNQSTQTDSTAILTDAEVYNGMFKKAEHYVTQDGVLTGYWDDTINKVRYLAFDYWGSTEHENAIQKALALVDTTPSGYSIIVFCHAVWTYSNDYTETIWNTLGESIVNSFAEKKTNGADIICINVGHIHKEYHGFYTNLLCVASNTDNYNESLLFGGSEMTQNTTTEQSMEYVIIDKTNKVMNRIIVGASDSRKFNYETGALITP